jgi:hypothetical protein
MTPKRFEQLAEAYGGDVARWPDAEREAAALFMTRDPAGAEAVLSDARNLDAQLDLWTALRVSPTLTEAVLTPAPTPRARPGWLGWLAPAGLGAGLAAACAAGLLMGSQLGAAPIATDPQTDAITTALEEDEFGLLFDDEDA